MLNRRKTAGFNTDMFFVLTIVSKWRSTPGMCCIDISIRLWTVPRDCHYRWQKITDFTDQNLLRLIRLHQPALIDIPGTFQTTFIFQSLLIITQIFCLVRLRDCSLLVLVWSGLPLLAWRDWSVRGLEMVRCSPYPDCTEQLHLILANWERRSGTDWNLPTGGSKLLLEQYLETR